jgi:aspartate carbamoyltransferase catalytic subunit
VKTLAEIGWDEFNALSPERKAAVLSANDVLFHVLLAQQFRRAQLDALGHLATCVRQIAKNKEGMVFLGGLLPHKRVMLFFTQPSSRTFLSFCAACQTLGMRILEVRDPATSSEFKGESREDSIRTFSSYCDAIVMRSEIGGLAERVAWVLSRTDRPVPIVNAGSGKDQHPTQALLDIYTLQRSFENSGGIEGKTVMYVGDLARGRTVRSLAMLMTQYRRVRQLFVAPEPLQIGRDILEMLDARGAGWEVSTMFSAMIPRADAIYMTRVQDEWDGGAAPVDISAYCFRPEHLALLKPHAVLLHPFPRRAEIAPEVDRDPRAVYWRQMRNGMWIRAALFATLFGVESEITGYHARHA